MNPQKKYEVSDVEQMLGGCAFQPGERLRQAVRMRLSAPRQRWSLAWPASWSFSRRALATVMTVLAAALLVTGVVVALSPQERAAGVVDGIRAVYEENLIHPVAETRQAGDIAVTLDWVYADWNQVVVAYTAQGPTNNMERIDTQLVSAVLEDGTTLQGSVGAGYSETNTAATVIAFPLLEDIRNQDQLHLHLKLNVAYTPQYPTLAVAPESDPSWGQLVPMQINRAGGGEVDFTLAIPVTPGKVLPVGKTVEAKGITARLESLTVAPSLTVASLCFQVPDPAHYRDWMPIVTLKAGGNQYSGAASGYRVGDTTSCQRVEIRASVPADQPQYCLRVDELVGFKFGLGDSPAPGDHPEQQMRVEGPWVFVVK